MSKQHFFLVMILCATAGTSVLADESSWNRAGTKSGSEVASSPSYGGKLVCNDANKDGTAPYVLVDKWGAVQTYVQPGPGLDLQPYVDRQVWIQSGGMVTGHDGVQCIKADAVTLSDRPAAAPLHWLPYRQANAEARTSDRAVRQTAYQEPAGKQRSEPIPAPQPIPSSENAPAVAPAVPAPAELPVEGDFAADEGPATMVGPGPEGPGVPCGSCPERCGTPCDRPCGQCCGLAPYWVHLDTLLWWTSGMAVPPLVTTGPSADNPGIMGYPGTVVLAGSGRILDDLQVGGRLQVGTWLNECGTVGVEGEYLGLGGDSYQFREFSPGNPILARPFYDVTRPTTDPESYELVALPGVIAGSVAISARTWFQGAGVDMRFFLGGCEGCWSPPCDCCEPIRSGWRVDLTLGYRYLQLADRLGVEEDLTSFAPTEENPSSAAYLVRDDFSTKNRFDGGQIGLLIAMHRNRWSLDVTPKIAFGNTHETASVNGSTLTTDINGTPALYQGGLLALPSVPNVGNGNIGNYSKNVFAVVPELGLTLGYQLTPRLQATIGYSFLYWSRVMRAGDQIDFKVNPNLMPNPSQIYPTSDPNHPAFTYNQAGFWAQGINLGLGYRW